MSPFECYKEYLSLKQHFTKPNYDYFRYKGKIKAKQESFNKRKDKIFFQKLAKHPDLHNFLLANFAKDENSWVRGLAYSEEAENIYKDWIRRKQSLTYNFKNDLGKLDDNFDSNFTINTEKNSHPYLLRLYFGDLISLETMCILLDITGAKKHWDSKLKYDLVYEPIKTKIEKYTPFIQYDKEKIKKIIVDFFG